MLKRMDKSKLLEYAETQGKIDAKRGRMRVSPFYEEYAVVDGRKVDITRELSWAWCKGFDDGLMERKV